MHGCDDADVSLGDRRDQIFKIKGRGWGGEARAGSCVGVSALLFKRAALMPTCCFKGYLSVVDGRY